MQTHVMKNYLLLPLMIWAVPKAQAQETENLVVNGAQLYDFIAKEAYKYPIFQKAKVYFTNADSGAGRLNYNYLLQTMQFVSDKGDTLVFADESSIRYIVIGTDTFINEHGFFEKAVAAPGFILAKRQSLKLRGGPQKLGAYGISTATLNIPSEDVSRAFGYTAKLDVNEEFNFTRKIAWFIKTGDNGFTELNKANIHQLFQSRATAVNGFIKANKLNLSRREDVLRLIKFIE